MRTKVEKRTMSTKRLTSKRQAPLVSPKGKKTSSKSCGKKIKNKKDNKSKKSCKQQTYISNGKPISRFKPGQSGNPNGRPKGSTNKFSIAELQQAIKHVEKNKRKLLMVHYVEKVWDGTPADMSSLMNYLLPKQQSIQQTNVNANLMPEEEATQLHKELVENMQEYLGETLDKEQEEKEESK